MKKMDKAAGLWQPSNEKSPRLYTKIPNALIAALVGRIYVLAEIRIILYICRMSFGFHREDTNYLSLDDFKEVTGTKKTHLSKTLKKLLNEYEIFRHSKNGDKYKYAINLLPFGIKMKHYRIGQPNDKLDDGYYEIGNINDDFGNRKDQHNNVILYSSKGYKNHENAYIKDDIKNDKKYDKGDDDGKRGAFKSAPTSNSKGMGKVDAVDGYRKASKGPDLSAYGKNHVVTRDRLMAEIRKAVLNNNSPDAVVKRMSEFFDEMKEKKT